MEHTEFARYAREFTGDYLSKERDRKENTLRTYRMGLALFLKYMSESEGVGPSAVSLEDITEERIKGFAAWIRARGCKPATCNLRLGSLRAFFNFLVDRGVEDAWPRISWVKRQMEKVPAKVPECLSEEAAEFLLSLPDASTRTGLRDAVLLRLLYDAGARVREITALTVSDIRIGKKVVVKFSGSLPRFVTLPSKKTRELFKKYVEKTGPRYAASGPGPLFPGYTGGPVTYTVIRNVVRKYVREAADLKPGLVPEDTSPKTLRQSKALHLIKSGKGYGTTLYFLGQASLGTTALALEGGIPEDGPEASSSLEEFFKNFKV